MKNLIPPIIIIISIFFLANTILGADQQRRAATIKNPKLGVWDPLEKSPFKIPKKYVKLLANYRTKWIRLTNIKQSGLHWNQGIVTYINAPESKKTFVNNYVNFIKTSEDEDCFDYPEDCGIKFKSYPVGTIVLKENYFLKNNIPDSAASLAVMIKKEKGYSPKYGDWQFLQLSPEGQIITEGNASKNVALKALCGDCHQNINTRDYIFSTFLTPEITR